MLENIEKWKIIEGFPRYMISNQGRIKSLIGKEKLLHPFTTNKGYLSIKLSKKNTIKGQYIIKSFKVHRLVA